MTPKSKNFDYKAAVLLSLVYLLYGMLRKSVPVTTPSLLHELDFSKADIGLISASFGVGFGLSKLVGGYVCDVYSCRRILASGLLIASISCLCFLLIPLKFSWYFRLVWFCHGFAQGVGWPAIASLIYDHFDAEGRSSVWSIISSAGNVGSILVPVLFLPLMESVGWQVTFLAIGLAGVAGSIFLIWGLDEVPKYSIGKAINRPEEEEPSMIHFIYSSSFWFLILSNAITSFLMTSVADWLGQYLIEVCNLSRNLEIQQIFFANEVGGFLGTLSSGILCDRVFYGRSDICCLFYSLLLIPALLGLPVAPYSLSEPIIPLLSPHATTLLSVVFLGVAINGPKTLSGMTLRNMIPSSSFGVGGGVLGVFAQFGVFFSGTGVGWMLQNHQWTHFIRVLLFSSVISSSFLFLMVIFTPHRLRKVKIT